MSKHKYRNYITYDVITDENVKCENCAYWKERYAPHPYCTKTSKNDFCGEFKERRQTMSDLIKRSDAINELAEYLMMDAQKEWAGTASEDIEDWKELAETVFDDIPSAEKQGEWLHKIVTSDFRVEGQCSVCKERRRIDNYCPNCGAKMKGEDDA